MKLAAIVFLVCALALGVVGWRWLAVGDAARESFSSPAQEAARDEIGASSYGLQAPDRDTSTARTVASPQVPPGQETLPLKLFAAPTQDPATLIVRVVDRRTARGLAALPVSIDTLEQTRTRTDIQGLATLQVPPNVEWRLRVRPNNYHTVYEQRSVPPLAPSERREILVEVSLMERESFFARVLDGETRQPVPLAKVFAGREPVALASSDAEGVFDIPVSSEGSVMLSVKAAGYADASLRTRQGCDSRGEACELLLSRSAVLTVRLQGTTPDSWPQYSVSCSSPSQVVSGVLFEMGMGSGGDPAPRSFVCDEQGVARIDGLPSDQALVVRVSREAKLLPLRLPSLQLAPGESRELVVDLDSGCQLRGRTLDPSGVPVGKVSIWLMPLIPDANQVAGVLDGNRTSASTTSDENGRFVIDGVAPGAWQLSPAAGILQTVGEVRSGPSQESLRLVFPARVREPGAATESGARDDVAPWIQDIVVPAGPRTFDIDLTVYCGRFIHGLVVDAEGKAAQGVSVFAYDGGEQASAVTDAAGEFELGPLGPGEFQVWARDVFNSRGFAAPQAAAVGARDVLLELRPAGRLRLLYGGAAPLARYAVFQGKVAVARGTLQRGAGVHLQLPQGQLVVEITPEHSTQHLVREIELSAGDERELTLRDDE